MERERKRWRDGVRRQSSREKRGKKSTDLMKDKVQEEDEQQRREGARRETQRRIEKGKQKYSSDRKEVEKRSR